MSDQQKLKDSIIEYNKVKKDLDDKLNKAVEKVQQTRQEQAAQSSRPD